MKRGKKIKFKGADLFDDNDIAEQIKLAASQRDFLSIMTGGVSIDRAMVDMAKEIKRSIVSGDLMLEASKAVVKSYDENLKMLTASAAETVLSAYDQVMRSTAVFSPIDELTKQAKLAAIGDNPLDVIRKQMELERKKEDDVRRLLGKPPYVPDFPNIKTEAPNYLKPVRFERPNRAKQKVEWLLGEIERRKSEMPIGEKLRTYIEFGGARYEVFAGAFKVLDTENVEIKAFDANGNECEIIMPYDKIIPQFTKEKTDLPTIH